ncbi:hypothetical protein GUITHDRAFT_72300 [Guillardia theta CCMP2712]|uniref:tRNA-specific adenosine deaminase 1 n=1 Tax=Guillardia theta (strain CCMP2712) TaxID=905079 RepID=L1J7A1_GUITC|nr:hypothetical protein GUITHDRAFT_72300 [Guillardia theta CCMP2712]EKX44391.1 hypothetical protein GUITHDRAFT_72300 [Guillardia theta CCMP2712]|eukprot:XP_005831371.1 hypothetical protein GUITHDRAFT_72300 [Guillardia theta CCMP2712]
MSAPAEPPGERGRRDLGDLISQLVIETYKTLPKSGKPNAGEWTILAGIVATRVKCKASHEDHAPSPHSSLDPSELEFRLLSLATGNKCLGASKLRGDGRVLNDSHAEVLARRAFMSFLYSQVELFLEDDRHLCLLDRSSKLDQGAASRLRLKHACQLHLYVSQAPCGDASNFEIGEANLCVSCRLDR